MNRLERGAAERAVTADPPLRILTMTTLFPSNAAPRHGIFVETRLRELCRCAQVDLRVIAPVPWFPLRWQALGRYATFAATAKVERRQGTLVCHPRFLSIPHVATALRPNAIAAACYQIARKWAASDWQADVIDAHYLYPDGVAAALLASRLRRPLVLTARGSDVNVIAEMPGPRRRILAALRQASRIITVSRALERALVRLGAPADRIEVLRNGVDLSLFRDNRRDAVRGFLGVHRNPLIASVGNLVALKGHDLVLRAAQRLPDAHVVIVGGGQERSALEWLSIELGLRARTHFIDNVAQADLAAIYSAADALALASTSEGWPNVVLEAMACGTPVVATDVGAVREIITDNDVGQVVASRSVEQFADALRHVLNNCTDRERVRGHATSFGWRPVARRYYEVLSDAAGGLRLTAIA